MYVQYYIRDSSAVVACVLLVRSNGVIVAAVAIYSRANGTPLAHYAGAL